MVRGRGWAPEELIYFPEAYVATIMTPIVDMNQTS
jgi:hypothetical protein